MQVTVPGLASEIGSHHASYSAKSRMKTTKIPLLEDTRTGFCVAESPAILSFLCEHYGWENTLYGKPGSQRKVTIDSYMHWHHTGTRALSAIAYPYFRDIQKDDSYFEKALAKTKHTLTSLEEGWFSNMLADPNTGDGLFLAGGDHPSIADLLAYEEIVQLTVLGMLHEDIFRTDYPKIFAWMGRMSQQPYHDAIHKSLVALGDVTATPTDDALPLSKRLGVATKAGLKAIKEAQSDFPTEDTIPPASKL